MSRSASDATRFTATSPQAHSKPVSYRSAAPSINGSTARNPGPGGLGGGGGSGGGPEPTETPQQKVARLRAAHAARRAAEVSKWDRFVSRGRSVADSAHKITVVGLVGLSAIAGIVTIYSFWDLSRYNRQKQQEWLAKQYDNLQKELIEASKAERRGIATPEQMLLLNRERAAEQAKQEKQQRKSLTSYVTGLFSTKGLKKEDSGEVALPDGVRDESIANSMPVAPVPDSNVAEGSVMQAVKQHRREGENALQAKGAAGGSLDQMAASVSQKAGESVSYWSSWFGSK